MRRGEFFKSVTACLFGYRAVGELLTCESYGEDVDIDVFGPDGFAGAWTLKLWDGDKEIGWRRKVELRVGKESNKLYCDESPVYRPRKTRTIDAYSLQRGVFLTKVPLPWQPLKLLRGDTLTINWREQDNVALIFS